MSPLIALSMIYLFLLVFGIASWVAAIYYFKKIKQIKRSNKLGLRDYTQNIVIGIVSGIIVLLVDRCVTLFFSSVPKIDFSSLLSLSFVFNITALLILLLITSGVLLFGVSFIFYQGAVHLKK